jgi:hypothetical protein
VGIRSDVGVCISRSAFLGLSRETVKFLATADDILDNPEGVLYHFSMIKWYHEHDVDIVRLYDELDKLTEAGRDDEFLVLEACHDYPTNESAADRGNWMDNPWGMIRQIRASIEYANA